MLDDTTLHAELTGAEDFAALDAELAAPRRAAPVPSVLIASTTWWAFPARLASACAARGFDVHAIVAADNPVAKTRAVRRMFAYAPLRPIRALEQAMRESRAALVLPCDDRARAHLHRLHGATRDASIRATIETSLGAPGSFRVAERRSDLIGAARTLGLEAPETLTVADASGLDAALSRIGLPAVLKVDGTWGGFGVAIVRSEAQARAAFARFARPLSATRAIKRMLVDRDAFDVPLWLSGEMPRVSLQRYVAGVPANSLSVCRGGRVLRTICVKTLLLQRPLGAAAAVQVIEHAGMRVAAEKLARRLDLSGFLGLDFLLGGDDGEARLVEMNARATPLAHLCFGAESDLIGGLAELAGGLATPARPRQAPRGVVAYFPQAWHSAPDSPYLTEGFHDVPWNEPELLKELLRLPHPDRGVLARALRGLRQLARDGRAASTKTQWDAA
jgi:hypothetical protein